MRRTLLGLYAYLAFAIVLLIWLPIMGAITLFDRGNLRRRGRWMRRFGQVTAWAAPTWRFRVEGRGPADIRRRAYVVVANHVAAGDPFLLSSLPWDMRWIAKASLFKSPGLGWLMRLGGDLPVVRGEGASVRPMMAKAKATLESGLPLMIFPEGTRTTDGNLGRFKDGAFELAIATGAPILPVVIAGTERCTPKGSWFFGDADAAARVLAPIPTAGLTAADLPALRERVRDLIAVEVERLRATLAAPARAATPSTDMALPAAVAAAVLTAAAAAPSTANEHSPRAGRRSADDTTAHQ